MGTLDGRRALVTGSTNGIGKAVARAFAREGAFVVVTGRDAGRGAEVVAGIEADGGLATFVAADLGAGSAEITRLATEAAQAAGGPVDLLVNNTAYLIGGQSMLDADEKTIDQALALNVKVPFLLTAALVPAMVEAGSGVVINMGSINGLTGMAQAALYGASKAALHSLTKSWAAELASQGVRVNTIAPGPTMTEWAAHVGDAIASIAAPYPDRRPGTPDEVAAAAVFLAGPGAAHIHGATVPVDGGMHSSLPA